MKFTKFPDNPVFGSDLGTVFDVYISKQDGRLRMDFSWRPEKALAVAFSDDGRNWSKPYITLRSNPESGFEDIVNRNCVLKIDGKYKMWYTGQMHLPYAVNRGYSYIGCAESDDGITFRRILDEPVMIPEFNYEGASVMNPCVLYENGIYRMWYSAGETYEPNVLCYAESSDGLHWKKRLANPIFVCNRHIEYESARVGGCHVVPHKDLGYIMFYIGYKDIHTACVCVAASKNGLTGFRRFKGNPIISPSPEDFDSDSCYKPSAIYLENENKWLVFYNGRTAGVELIGGAEGLGDFVDDDFEDTVR